ncbi:hypothetical protein AB0I72_19325 [Nocardiopsis sp. NPDC049922]|uniref:hypothetical protein n=1 Tax=Nocardiopsis sp. NPDC049922 TaxID=3155157 RepID=UPI0033F41062
MSATCRICHLAKKDHGPDRDGRVYADIFGWHTFAGDRDQQTGTPPPGASQHPTAAAGRATPPRPRPWWGSWRHLIGGTR